MLRVRVHRHKTVVMPIAYRLLLHAQVSRGDARLRLIRL
nr:MAG TPA: hypothetical protein [Caudoviricetes sp.]DAT34090.1 MAG TPA: hypothetical protein [Caudoviricetes sp.]